MKLLLLIPLMTLRLLSCDPNSSQRVGNREQFDNRNNVGTPPPGTGTGSQTTDTPIDGGIGVLLVAGALYGVRRIRNGRKKTGS